MLTCFVSQLQSQEKYSSDVASQDKIIAALYEVISGEKGVKRDWERFAYLFIPDARLIPSSKRDSKTSYRIMTPADYIQNAGPRLEENGFHEIEINRVTEQYGSMAHVWSTYESYRSKSDAKPFARGINSIQLLHDGSRWWIMQIYWLGETPELPLSSKYLPAK